MSHKCKLPKLAELVPCVAQCAVCGRYWELKATWVPWGREVPRQGGDTNG